ncbi:MAG: hypothetical protein IK125_02635 [Lachnospiraceae bacterium]|nr:hypothetical protein [Lachnospiraceae bacterium]
MSEMQTLAGSVLWYILSVVSIVLMALAPFSWIISMKNRRTLWPHILSTINVALAFCAFLYIMDCGKSISALNYDSRYTEFQKHMFSMPWIYCAVAELICAMNLVSVERRHWRDRKMYLAPNAIRHTENYLPEGIAISDATGTVRLSNLRMDVLSRELTGEVLSDADRFLSRIEEQGEQQNGQLLLRTADGRVWLFENEPIEVGGREYRQLIARDVTELQKIIDELKEKNERLQDIRRRMKVVSDLSGDMFIAEEQARARVALHNQLGQVLLMGQHYLNYPESTDPEMVYLATRQMNSFLLGETSEPEVAERDAITDAVAMAKSIGVTVLTDGEAPKDVAVRKVISQAIVECAANTVKHAGGDTLTVTFTADDDAITVSITNNGRPPKGTVAESGGLLFLRRKVEGMGGSMHIDSSPAFVLTLHIPTTELV